jgi:hypothetical protein
MGWLNARKIVATARNLIIGVAVVALLYWVSQLTAPWWNPDAFNWKYADASVGQSLSIKAKDSTLRSITGQSYTPTLMVICKAGYVNVAVDMGFVLCMGDCSKGGSLDAFEYFVTDPGVDTQDGHPGSWYMTAAAHSLAKRFSDPTDSPELAKVDAPEAAAFIRRLAMSKEFWIAAGQSTSKFDTHGLASALPLLAQSCPALR